MGGCASAPLPAGRAVNRCFLRQTKAQAHGTKGTQAPEQRLHRRQRDGAAIQARTKEQSFAHVGVLSRRKAPRFSRGCSLSRGCIEEESRSVRRSVRSSRPDAIRTGDPGARSFTRRVRAHRQERAQTFAQELRPVNCSVHASGTRWRKPSRCRSRPSGPRCGNAP